MSAPDGVRVRPATVADAPAFARIVVAALRAKYRPAMGRRAEAGAAAIVAAGIHHSPRSRHLVAEVEGRIAGVVHLELGPGDDGRAVSAALAAAIGTGRTLWASLVLGLLGQRPATPGEARIDELAVAPWARRRGVARALLAACAALAAEAGAERLTLLVTADNHPALALYRQTGFRTVRRRRWLVARLIFRAPGAHFMEWRPTP